MTLYCSVDSGSGSRRLRAQKYNLTLRDGAIVACVVLEKCIGLSATAAVNRACALVLTISVSKSSGVARQSGVLGYYIRDVIDYT